MLLATDFMCEALARATSILGLTWRASSGQFEMVPEGDGSRISDEFSFAPATEPARAGWLMAEASATVASDQPMTVTLRIVVPSDRGGTSDAATFVVEGTVAYPGYLEVSAAEADAGFTSEQRALTLDMVLKVFLAARECDAHHEADREKTAPTLPTPQGPLATDVDSGALEVFSVFALSRMYRWGVLAFDEDSAALSLLRRYAASALTQDVIRVLSEEQGTPHECDAVLHEQSRARVDD